MNKYRDLCAPSHAPELRFDLLDLDYAARLNAVREVLESARERGWGERTAYYCGGRERCFADVHRDVHRRAHALRAAGVGIGDCVVLRLPDDYELVVLLLAVQAIGAVAMPTFVQLRADDLSYRISDADARFVITSEALLDEVEKTPQRRDAALQILVTDTGATPYRALSALMPDGDVKPEYADTDAEQVCLLLYTSGSTGAPKGTCHCHRDMLAIADTYWRHCVAPGPDDIVAGPPSIAFAMGFGLSVYFPLRLGHAAVLEPDKSPERALEMIERHGVTIFVGVVSYFNAMARLIDATRANLGSLRLVLTGGEPLTDEAARRWTEVTGTTLEQFIGTTEMLHIFVTSSRPGAAADSSTLGRSVPGYDVAVLDPNTFTPVPDGTPGLLSVRGPTGTVYWRKPDHQAATVVGGWNVFQDLVTRDAHGCFHYIARFDEVIVSSGYNISPVQVESVLLRHPAVLECACVPAPDPTGDRSAVVKAFVVPSASVTADDALVAELQDFVKTHAPPYMYPRVVAFEPELPKTITGKIQRGQLRARENFS
ncbi:MAG: acyl-CoA synthetase [Pseudomonadota bacterium]